MHKGFKCLDVATSRVYISHDVIFYETAFSFTTLHPNAGAHLRFEIILLPETKKSFIHFRGQQCYRPLCYFS
jgi:hypothetical protein